MLIQVHNNIFSIYSISLLVIDMSLILKKFVFLIVICLSLSLYPSLDYLKTSLDVIFLFFVFFLGLYYLVTISWIFYIYNYNNTLNSCCFQYPLLSFALFLFLFILCPLITFI